jgi:hypothetical protein
VRFNDTLRALLRLERLRSGKPLTHEERIAMQRERDQEQEFEL